MHTHGLDYLLVGPSADMVYLTGAHLRPSERLSVFILPQEGPPHFVVPFFEAPSLPTLPAGTQIHTWEETDNPIQLAAGLMANGLKGKPGGINCTIGVAEKLWAVYLLRFQSHLPRAAFTPATMVLSAARQIKSADEIEIMKQAGSRSDAGFMELIKRPFIGRSEIEISREYAHILEAQGLTVADAPLVASGPNGASPHHHSGDRIIEDGDLIVLDFFGTWRDYGFDCTRTVFAGSAPDAGSEELNVYRVVAKAQERAVQQAKAGMTCEELDSVAREYITRGGYGDFFIHRLGHGLGMDVHEGPYIVQGNATVLQNGMVFSIEPGAYLPGRFGVRVEDIVALVDGKAVRMNNADHGVIVVS
jgi:D-alanyl-D-alanine dipeptidase